MEDLCGGEETSQRLSFASWLNRDLQSSNSLAWCIWLYWCTWFCLFSQNQKYLGTNLCLEVNTSMAQTKGRTLISRTGFHLVCTLCSHSHPFTRSIFPHFLSSFDLLMFSSNCNSLTMWAQMHRLLHSSPLGNRFIPQKSPTTWVSAFLITFAVGP